MAITLGREAYEELKCFGLPDEYAKDIRAAVTELRRRGYDASVAVLNYLVEEDRVRLADDDRWSAEDIDAASELARCNAAMNRHDRLMQPGHAPRCMT